MRAQTRLSKEPDHHICTKPGCYLVTLRTRNRKLLFGSIFRNRMVLSDFGEYARFEWERICAERDRLRTDEYVVMPNHLHGIVIIPELQPEALLGAGTMDDHYGDTVSPSDSIPALIKAFKSVVTRRINSVNHCPGEQVWERNYEEEVIRSRKELEYYRHFVRYNPRHWWEDDLRPAADLYR